MRFDEDATWELLSGAGIVTIAKGKKVQEFVVDDKGKPEILKQAMGPSGNLRAPTFRVGDRFIIGFNSDLYEEWVK